MSTTFLLTVNMAMATMHLDTDDQLTIFDVSDPLVPEKLGTGNGAGVFYNAFRSLALGDGYVYIAGEHAALVIDARPGEYGSCEFCISRCRSQTALLHAGIYL